MRDKSGCLLYRNGLPLRMDLPGDPFPYANKPCIINKGIVAWRMKRTAWSYNRKFCREPGNSISNKR